MIRAGMKKASCPAFDNMTAIRAAKTVLGYMGCTARYGRKKSPNHLRSRGTTDRNAECFQVSAVPEAKMFSISDALGEALPPRTACKAEDEEMSLHDL